MSENIIYYGPPGTGKTYLLQSIMNDYIDYDITDAHLQSVYTAESKDWILLTLVLLQNQGKMLSKDIQLKVDNLGLNVKINVPAILEKHNLEQPQIPNVFRENPKIFFKTKSETAKPEEWYVDLFRVQQYSEDFVKKYLSGLKITKRYAFVTFHQSYSYENFIEGIRPEYIAQTQSIDYSPKDGVFKALCAEASAHKEKPYAIFIDEINRGNISEILGELISLIEVDKRDGETCALSVVLPYSKSLFSVPSNINLYGTMNTADRSIDQIDIALRRRFKFKPMLPSSIILKNELDLQGVNAHDIDGIDLIKLFETLNARIEILIDSQHLLGHALFIGCKTIEDISEVIKNNVVPLLEEYFYDDIKKVQMVFNDLDENGNLRSTAIYKHLDLIVDEYFSYTGDYMIDDKRRYCVSDNISKDSIEQIYL